MPLMSDLLTKPRPRQRSQLERPRLYKVILLNDDFTPREFVVTVLKAVFRMNEGERPVMPPYHWPVSPVTLRPERNAKAGVRPDG